MITDPFDAGPRGAFKALCRSYPDDTVFRGDDGFRSLWGPIFYRGRADGSARLLVIGQDPAQTEAFTRRILSGQAGRRVQGFVEKLGLTRRYLMVNAFLYGIYNQDMALPHLHDPEIEAYRNQWLRAALAPGRIEAVVTFGTPAREAWKAFLQSPAGAGVTVFQQAALHPTADKPNGPISRQDLLDNWNVALQHLHPRIAHPDAAVPLVPYGADFTAAELPEIPSRDLPMGLQAWMRSTDFWATLASPPGTERANISIQVP
ncbi:uracil-DNA glycosylase family protein [Cellulomonas alba]|uniref:Uracil-DNA glycosylase family protein n=1 Tax=Cellulomonas alba TaxID=3053467 RepID=A0ABT7SFF2_9CELL|nr:uracil-DNA glycosylase family protein [Cellulomonas alba]MDM7854764.1 uracil-DNA glycosylase family protein [Cellulomonas alba]